VSIKGKSGNPSTLPRKISTFPLYCSIEPVKKRLLHQPLIPHKPQTSLKQEPPPPIRPPTNRSDQPGHCTETSETPSIHPSSNQQAALNKSPEIHLLPASLIPPPTKVSIVTLNLATIPISISSSINPDQHRRPRTSLLAPCAGD
jgi:hypothetical protein